MSNMETEITRSDESEGRVDFSGYIFISWETKTKFKEDLEALINQYAI